jgi:hypothetical protein
VDLPSPSLDDRMSVEQIARPVTWSWIDVLRDQPDRCSRSGLVAKFSTELGTDWFLVLRAIIDSD